MMRTLILLMLSLPVVLAAAQAESGFPLADELRLSDPTAGVRLKDIVDIDGVRDNQLNGFGVVVGLADTGDDAEAVLQLLRQSLENHNRKVDLSELQTGNIALVALTATLPPFSRPGARRDVHVSSIGDAESLRGGILLQTPLAGADGRIYAVAQGAISVGGFGDATPGLVPAGRGQINHETSGVIPEGALVEREVPMHMIADGALHMNLRLPDFTTAHRIAQVLAQRYGSERVVARDAGTVSLLFAPDAPRDQLMATIADLQQLRVQPDNEARVVINERTGTIAIGNNVRIDPVAVSHGGLSLQILPTPEVVASAANPDIRTERLVWLNPVTGTRLVDTPLGLIADPAGAPGTMNVIEGTTVEAISNALNALGARPRDIIAIFAALERMGALHAELVVM
jgi:flagellar P-ring protein precursor FlgI